MAEKLSFASDYLEGAHPAILARLSETNMVQETGYGFDCFSETAREKIRKVCSCPDAEIHFLAGGTQTNAVVIGAILAKYQGVLAAETGHISSHEAGAIEAGGHKVLTLPPTDGKISAAQVAAYVDAYEADENFEHLVMPGMVYISQPTENGTLYTKDELTALRKVCDAKRLALYVDGARLAYALACKENDVSLADLAALCDAFYIGGTKCGALVGEALVVPKRGGIPHLFTIVKQSGALLAKGRICGVQFDTLFTDDLYFEIGKTAIDAANRIRAALDAKGYFQPYRSPTNQIFIALDDAQKTRLAQSVDLGFWENLADGRTVLRIATSWATTEKAVDTLISLL